MSRKLRRSEKPDSGRRWAAAFGSLYGPGQGKALSTIAKQMCLLWLSCKRSRSSVGPRDVEQVHVGREGMCRRLEAPASREAGASPVQYQQQTDEHCSRTVSPCCFR